MNIYRFWGYNGKFSKKLSPVGISISSILMGTAILSLKNYMQEYLIPYAPYLMLGVQMGLGMITLSFLRLNMANNSIIVRFLLFSMFVWAFASSLWSSETWLVFKRSLLVFFPLIILFLLVISDHKPVVTFHVIARGMVVFVTILSLIGLFIYVFGNETWENGLRIQKISLGPISLKQRVYGKLPFLRITSLLGNPNTLASWIVICLPLIFYLYKISFRYRWILIGKFFIVMCALIFTFSRNGFVTAFLAFGIFYFFSTSSSFDRMKQIMLFVFVITIEGLLLLNFVNSASIRFSLYFNLRNDIWRALSYAYLKAPLSGYGFGVSKETILMPAEIKFSAHNLYLQILVETGIVGFLLFILMWLSSIYIILKRLQNKKNGFEIKIVLSTILSINGALFLHQLFEGTLLRYGFYTLFWGYTLAVGINPHLAFSKSKERINKLEYA